MLRVQQLSVLFFLMSIAVNVHGQPGPDWASIISKNQSLFKANRVMKAKVAGFEEGVISTYFYESYDTNGFIQTSFDCRFAPVDSITKVFWSKIEFDYTNPDTLFVIGYQQESDALQYGKLDTLSWKGMVNDIPEKWKYQYTFAYGRDKNGFFRFEGVREYNEDGSVASIKKFKNDELMMEKVMTYEDGLISRTTEFAKTYEAGYKKVTETFFTYKKTGQPDSVYSMQYVNRLGYDDTTVTQVTRFNYTDKDEIESETVVKKGRLASNVKYDYSGKEEGKFLTRTYNSYGTVIGVVEFLEGGLEISGKFYTAVGRLSSYRYTDYEFFPEE